jgi:hypothetical protein
MKHRSLVPGIAALVMLAPARTAMAGMPEVLLSDLARMRIQTISFFVLCFLLSSWGIQRIWNAARQDFPRLPRLSYARANGLVALWGLLFVLVLTMISGARELMTPGAWTKQGSTYKLAGDVPATDPTAAQLEKDKERRRALDRLRAALWTYARHHDGRFPPNANPPEIPEDAWFVPDPSEMKYLYTPGLTADRGAAPVAYEPAIFDGDRFVLLTTGEIVRMNEGALRTALDRRGSP